MVHFNDFLVTKRMRPFERLSEAELCNKQIWQEYGTYLSEHARSKREVKIHLVTSISHWFI